MTPGSYKNVTVFSELYVFEKQGTYNSGDKSDKLQ